MRMLALDAWSHEKTLCLINLFKENPCLWEETDFNYKNRTKKLEVWNNIGNAMNMSSTEVDKKMKVLIGQYRRELRKELDDDFLYKSKWVFYKALSFLMAKYSRRIKREEFRRKENIRNGIIKNSEQSLDLKNEIITINDESQPYNNMFPEEPLPVQQEPLKTIVLPPQEISKAVYINNTPKPSKHPIVIPQNIQPDSRPDEFDKFGEYIADCLRKLKNRAIQIDAKLTITNALYNAELKDYNEMCSLNGDGDFEESSMAFESHGAGSINDSQSSINRKPLVNCEVNINEYDNSLSQPKVEVEIEEYDNNATFENILSK